MPSISSLLIRQALCASRLGASAFLWAIVPVSPWASSSLPPSSPRIGTGVRSIWASRSGSSADSHHPVPSGLMHVQILPTTDRLLHLVDAMAGRPVVVLADLV